MRNSKEVSVAEKRNKGRGEGTRRSKEILEAGPHRTFVAAEGFVVVL